MFKIKNKSSASKRFRFTGTGKLRRAKAHKSHILTKKSRGRKNRLKKQGLVHEADMPLILRCLPNRGN